MIRPLLLQLRSLRLDRRSALLLSLLVGSVAMALPLSASADPNRMIGFGPRGMAHAGAMLTVEDPLAAAINNPSMLAMTDGKIQLGAGYSFARPVIKVNDERADLLAPRGFHAGLALPFSHKDWDFGFGLSAHIPDRFLLRVHTLPATQPRAVMWDAPPHRLVANVGFGIGFKKLISLGVAASIFGRFEGEYLDIEIDASAGRTRATANFNFDFPTLITPVVGLTITPTDWIRISARYTGQVDYRFNLPIVATVTIPGTSVNGPLGLFFSGTSTYVPREAVVGAAFDIKKLTIGAELAFQNWAALTNVAAGIITDFNEDELGIEVPATSFVQTEPGYRNTFSPRAIASYDFDVDIYTITLRGGYSFVPTPVPEQRGLTNFADSNRHVVGLGGTFAFYWPYIKSNVEFDLGAQLQRVTRREMEKDNPVSPGGDLSIRGMVYGISAAGRISF